MPRLVDIINNENFPTSNLENLLFLMPVGSLMTPSLHDRILEAFQKKQKSNPVVMSGYGATEMASSMVMYRPGVLDDLEKQKMTVGRVRKPIQVKIIDDDGKELSPNEIGEICLLSPDRVRGYLGKPDLYWFHTGDLGTLGTGHI